MQFNAVLLVAALGRPCTDAEVALLTWQRATGQAVVACAEQPGQRRNLAPRSVRRPAVAAVSAGAAVRRVRGRSAAPYAVHVHVVTVDEHWCAPPCHEPTWEVAATKPSTLDGPYQLLEACIWLAEKRVALYAFDEAWNDARANNPCVSPGSTGPPSYACAAYYSFRESKRILEVRWQGDLAAPELSATLRAAFAKVLDLAVARGAEHSVLTYSGHGGSGDGSLFAGYLTADDSALLLGGATKSGKLSLLNFGTNCREGYVNNLLHLQPFAGYLIASELNVNGVTGWESDEALSKHMALRAEFEDLHAIKGLLEQRTDIKQVGVRLLNGWQRIWDGAHAPLAKEELKQTKALFDLAELQPFQAALRAKSPAEKALAKAAAEAALCDVQTYAASLGEMQAWHRLRPRFASTQGAFKWDVATHGLAFNFLKYRAPPCDLKPVT